MKEEIKKEWCSALRSGEYEQGIGTLRSVDDKFCCLGVLTDLYHKDTGKGQWSNFSSKSKVFKSEDSLQNYGLIVSDDIKEWSGLDSFVVYFEGKEQSLVVLNDDLELDFNTIADVIEREL